MSTWQIGESGTEVSLKGTPLVGEVTFTVTNSSPEQDRSMLTITPLDGAADPWFEVEEPQRLVAAGDSVTYLCQVKIPDGTPAGGYAMQGVVYSADRDPGETSATSKRVAIRVPEPNGKPPPPPWWVWAIVAAIVIVVIAVILELLFKPDGNDKITSVGAPTVEGELVVGQTVTMTPGSWSEPNDALTFDRQWVRCEDAEGGSCQ